MIVFRNKMNERGEKRKKTITSLNHMQEDTVLVL